MRHDRHFVEELAEQAATAVGLMIPIDRIETNREQPRTALGDLTELTTSVRTRGVLEPLIVRKLTDGGKYQLIAGERRLHAAIEAGLAEVPCIELAVSDQEALELALVENLQRKDLTPFEEAEGFRTLVDKYRYTHDNVATAVGKSRPTISESLKLLAIPPAIRDLCRHADITAKSVLLLIARAASIDEMERLVQEIAERGLDRYAARTIAQQAPEAAVPAATDSQAAERAPGGGPFRPIQIRFRPSADAPVHLALSIRRPDVSRDDLIATVEDLLDRLRNGELDDRLTPRSTTP